MILDTTEMKARCLCGKHVFTTSIPSALLPLPATSCHCTSCRHSMGALFMTDVPWPNESEDLSALKRYSFSPKMDYFSCETCSSQMFCMGTQTSQAPAVFTGVLENAPKLVKYDHHIFVADTKDGGASTWLVNGPDGEKCKRWKERSARGGEELDASWPGDAGPSKSKDVPSPDYTPLWCHCRGVKLVLKSGRDLASGTEKRLFNQPEKGTGRYTAAIDACDSCRMALGADIAHWAFVLLDHLYYSVEDAEQGATPPFKNIHELRDAVNRKDARIGTLAMYRSSERAERYHCSTCSATIFYTEKDLPDQADIAVGVLDHPEGARAESLLAWKRDSIDHIDDTKGGWRESLVKKYLEEASSGSK